MDIVTATSICLLLFLDLFCRYTYKLKIVVVSKGVVFVLLYDLHVLCSTFHYSISFFFLLWRCDPT